MTAPFARNALCDVVVSTSSGRHKVRPSRVLKQLTPSGHRGVCLLVGFERKPGCLVACRLLCCLVGCFERMHGEAGISLGFCHVECRASLARPPAICFSPRGDRSHRQGSGHHCQQRGGQSRALAEMGMGSRAVRESLSECRSGSRDLEPWPIFASRPNRTQWKGWFMRKIPPSTWSIPKHPSTHDHPSSPSSILPPFEPPREDQGPLRC